MRDPSNLFIFFFLSKRGNRYNLRIDLNICDYQPVLQDMVIDYQSKNLKKPRDPREKGVLEK